MMPPEPARRGVSRFRLKMPTAKLKFRDIELPVGDGTVAIGRTADNAVSFPDDSNVSRYHAEIKSRDGEYWLTDLGSSNGTQVNGTAVSGRQRLNDGDLIVLGGSSRISVVIQEIASEAPARMEPAVPAGSQSPVVPNAPAETFSIPRSALIFAGAAGGLALIVIITAGAVYLLSGASGCAARAVVSKPEPGDTISKPTEIELDVENGSCVSRAVFTIDGVEFATAEAPFSVTIDPKEFPDLADGFDHALGIRLEDENGAVAGTPATVTLAFESREIAAPPSKTPTLQANARANMPAADSRVSLIDVQEMSNRLIKMFPSGARYNVVNKQFLQEVQKRSAEYAREGFFDRAARYRDTINVAFVREQNLDAPLGFVLAMSRSNFVPDKKGADEGLWRMNGAFAAAAGYTGLCGTETLSDPSQNCAAKASALYMKALILGVFEGDVIYGVAAFGKSTQDAGAWKASLPASRSDLWNTVTGPAEREQLVRFFAAGIVAENPQKFGLKKDRPLSELYRLAM